MRFPERLNKLIICNVPHPNALLKAYRTLYLPQIIKSWYIFMFQLPDLPERVSAFANFAIFTYYLRLGGQIRDEELAYFREVWKQPGTLTATINWYRSLFKASSGGTRTSTEDRIRVPVRLIWGVPDFALDTEVAEWSRDYCRNFEIRYITRSSHFVQQDSPEEVNRLILEFFSESATHGA
jgi:pimeloyl-ACP methyl ester carboxylesterase